MAASVDCDLRPNRSCSHTTCGSIGRVSLRRSDWPWSYAPGPVLFWMAVRSYYEKQGVVHASFVCVTLVPSISHCERGECRQNQAKKCTSWTCFVTLYDVLLQWLQPSPHRPGFFVHRYHLCISHCVFIYASVSHISVTVAEFTETDPLDTMNLSLIGGTSSFVHREFPITHPEHSLVLPCWPVTTSIDDTRFVCLSIHYSLSLSLSLTVAHSTLSVGGCSCRSDATCLVCCSHLSYLHPSCYQNDQCFFHWDGNSVGAYA